MKFSFNKNRLAAFLICLALTVTHQAYGQGEDEDQANDETRAKKHPAVDRLISESASTNALKILFIGNSLLYGGDVPGAFLSLIKSKDAQAAVKMREVVGGNYTLKNHLEKGTALNAIDNEGPWDYVILQEQSSHLGNDLSKSIQETRPLATRITMNRSRVVVFDAWIRLMTHDYAELNRCNALLAQSVGAERIPVLMALAQANSIPGIKLFRRDGHHLDSEGVYLAACVLYAKILRRSPVGLPNKLYCDGRLICEADFNRAKMLQGIAANYAR